MLDIFCNVIDNFGDIGFSLRLARDLARHGITVCLYCDNFDALNKIETPSDRACPRLKTLPWPNDAGSYEPSEVVIEAFSCRLPKLVFGKARARGALFIELDYLTAEKFAEECHGLPSSSDGSESYFFFPGFTRKTGGLICEDSYRQMIARARPFDNEASEVNASLFCYETASLETVLNWLHKGRRKFNFDVYEWKPWKLVCGMFGKDCGFDGTIHDGSFSFRQVGMSDQEAYDQSLLSHGMNFVRGEDSIVRAMLSGRPFLWNIYPQDEDAHIAKLESFFNFAREACGAELSEPVRKLTLAYNGKGVPSGDPDDFIATWARMSSTLSKRLLSMTSLTENLISFIKSHGRDPAT